MSRARAAGTSGSSARNAVRATRDEEALAPPPLASSQPRILITNRNQREGAVGREVTVRGIQERTKVPTVCGIDVDGDDKLSDQRVTVQGVLRRYETLPHAPPPAPAAQWVGRSPGVYYDVVDPRTEQLAKTTRER